MLRIFIVYKKVQTQFEHARAPIILGRGPVGRDGWQALARRVLEDPTASWDHLHMEEVPGPAVRLKNVSKKWPIKLASGAALAPGASIEAPLPVRLTVGETLLQVESGDSDPDSDPPLETLTRPIQRSEIASQSLLGLRARDETTAPEVLVRWFAAVIEIQHASISSGDFYRLTARAVVEQIGLDRGLVLLRRGEDWEVIARHEASPGQGAAPEPGFSRNVLERVRREGVTFYQNLLGGGATKSLAQVDSLVVAPVFAENGKTVVGAVYGVRTVRTEKLGVGIRPPEAQLVQVLAAAVAAGLARLQSEADAARRRVQFEQFFSAELARELDRDPGLLEGRERELTILFSDLRGFSRVSEKLTPREVCELAGDVMDRLTERVREFGGTVVSYSGDGMMALWNAPADQPDHAVNACQAALAMHADLPALDSVWEPRIERKLALGIGLNTGLALVGNTGSKSRFMYGPQGHAVNLASRVEGATKQLGVPILITGSTFRKLNGAFATRKLCRARVVGIDGEVELYELHAEKPDPIWLARRDAYEQGLSQFESGRWAEACQTLYPLLAGKLAGAYDLPTLALVGRCIDSLKSPQRPCNPVVELDHK